jgi:hypothetical protein
MNADYVICIATKRGRTWRYVKEGGEWTQTTPAGFVRRLSAEQLLSHLLSPLSGDQSNLRVTVDRRRRRKRGGGSRASKDKASERGPSVRGDKTYNYAAV